MLSHHIRHRLSCEILCLQSELGNHLTKWIAFNFFRTRKTSERIMLPERTIV